MTARAAVHSLLAEDVELSGAGVAAVYAANSVDTPAEDLFIIHKWDPSDVAFKNRGRDRVQIWVHDVQRDYGRISFCLNRIRDLLLATTHLSGADGFVLTTSEWNGEGPDLFDPGYNTCTRYADFTVVSRYTASG